MTSTIHRDLLEHFGRTHWGITARNGDPKAWGILAYYIPFVVGPISFFSSMYICYDVLVTRRQLEKKPRDHLLLGMSFLDMCGSFAVSFSTTPGYSVENLDVSFSYPKYGTIETCEAQGFLAQLGFGVPLYSAALCLYYLLSVRYQVTDEFVMKYMIPFVHFLILGWSFSTATAALMLDLYNPAGVMGCWIHEGTMNDRGQNAEKFEVLFLALPLGMSFCFVFLSMIVLYWTVKRIEKRSRRWEFQQHERLQQRIEELNKQHSSQSDDSVVDHGNLSSSFRENGAQLVAQSTRAVKTLVNRFTSSRRGPDLPLSRKTGQTGLLYSASFLVVYLPLSLLGAQVVSDSTNFEYRLVVVLSAIFTPLQGFFNMLIYTSPKWLSWLEESTIFSWCCFLFCCPCYYCCRPNQIDDDLLVSNEYISSRLEDSSGHPRCPVTIPEELQLEKSMDFRSVQIKLQADEKRRKSIAIIGKKIEEDIENSIKDTELPSDDLEFLSIDEESIIMEEPLNDKRDESDKLTREEKEAIIRFVSMTGDVEMPRRTSTVEEENGDKNNAMTSGELYV